MISEKILRKLGLTSIPEEVLREAEKWAERFVDSAEIIRVEFDVSDEPLFTEEVEIESEYQRGIRED